MGSIVEPLGHGLRKHFLFDPKYINLNHGSFGTYPKVVQNQLRHFQDLGEARPDIFTRYQYPALLDESRTSIAELLHVPVEEIVLLPNATTGINVVLRGLLFKPGDTIIYFRTVYGACEKTVEYVCNTTEARAVKIDFDVSISDKDLISKFRACIASVKSQGQTPRVALFDTISSLPGIRMPFEELVKICKEEEILSLVDGAHGVGQIPLNLAELDADFLVSNCHKWLFVPRGCAVFHVPKRNQHFIRSAIPTSHGYISLQPKSISNPFPPSAKSPFVRQFEFTGTLDASPWLCIPTAIRFRREVCGGEEHIYAYCNELARTAGKEVAGILNTKVLENEEGTLGNCAMTNVKLPLEIGNASGQVTQDSAARVVQWLQNYIKDNYDTFITVCFTGDEWYTRMGAQVYLELDDFIWGANLLKEACQKVYQGQHMASNKQI